MKKIGILKYGESKILLRFGKSSVSQNKDKKRNKFGFVILFWWHRPCLPLYL
jgi:hypothetical protein